MVNHAGVMLFLVATWVGATSARIEWQQPQNISITCLSKGSVLIHCWTNAPAGRYVFTVGGPETDGAMRAEAGAVFRLWQDGQITEAALRGVVWVPRVSP